MGVFEVLAILFVLAFIGEAGKYLLQWQKEREERKLEEKRIELKFLHGRIDDD